MSWIFLLCQYLLCCHRVHRPRKVLYSHCSTLVNTLTLAIPHSFHMLSLFLQKLPFNYQVLCGSYLYISKKLLLVSQSFANLPNFRLPAPIDENFERLVMVFLKYKNGSNLERSLLSTIECCGADGPEYSKIFLITLICTLCIARGN